MRVERDSGGKFAPFGPTRVFKLTTILVYWGLLAMMTATAGRTPCEKRIYILPSIVATSLSPKYKELGHFTLLFCGGRQRNARRFKTHEHSHCSVN